MKKPLHTRYVPRPHPGKGFDSQWYTVNRRIFGVHGYGEMKFVAKRNSAQLACFIRGRSYALRVIAAEKQKSKIDRKFLKGWRWYKRNQNEHIKKHTKLLAFAMKALKAKAELTGVIDHAHGSSQYSIAANSPNKPFDIFTRTHPSTQKEVLDAIRQLPDMVEHLQKAFVDVEDGPLKGLLCWRGFIGITEKTIAGSEGKLLYVKLTTPGPITHRVENKIRNYTWTWVRVSEAYSTYRFLPIE